MSLGSIAAYPQDALSVLAERLSALGGTFSFHC